MFVDTVVLTLQSFAGLCGALMIGVGVVGAAIAGAIVDYTKKFEEVAKVAFAFASLSAVFFSLVCVRILEFQNPFSSTCSFSQLLVKIKSRYL